MKAKITLQVELIVTDACPANSVEQVAKMVENAIGKITGIHNPEACVTETE